MVRAAAEQENWQAGLRTAEHAVRTFRIDKQEKTRLIGILGNPRTELTSGGQLLEQVVLEEPPRPLSKVYHPPCFGMKVHFTTQVRRLLYRKEVLTLYPTKDYLDLLKGRFSSDCTSSSDLALARLAEPRFFNIRLFRDQPWIGSFYCLDLGDVAKTIVIDRIQIPRTFTVIYHQFFPMLSRAFELALRETSYRYLLVATAVSNHHHVRELFEAYLRTHRPKRVELPVHRELASHFESFSSRRPRFCVLVDLDQAQREKPQA